MNDAQIHEWAIDMCLSCYENDWIRRGCKDAADLDDAIRFLRTHLNGGYAGDDGRWETGNREGGLVYWSAGDMWGEPIGRVSWRELATIARRTGKQLDMFAMETNP